MKIIAALKQLELAVASGMPLPTVEDISKMASVSRNTVRNRDWALERLKSIKEAYKSARRAKVLSEGIECQAFEPTPAQLQEALQKQVEALLKQNALLYEEVLYLGKLVATKDVELDELRASSISAGKVRYMR
jgi:DNA-binding transcriptional regulator YhcF (GntR family)